MPVCRHNCEFDASIKREQHPPVAAMLQRLDSNNPAVDTVHTYGVLATNHVQLGLRCLPIYRFDDYHHPGVAVSPLLLPNYMARHPAELRTILRRGAAPWLHSPRFKFVALNETLLK